MSSSAEEVAIAINIQMYSVGELPRTENIGEEPVLDSWSASKDNGDNW